MVIQDHSVDGFFNGWLVKMLTILDSLFDKIVNTTSSPIGVGVVGSHEVAETSNTKTVLWPNGFIPGHFQLHMLPNVATSMPSLTSHSCGDSMPAVCQPGKLEPFTDHPSTNGCQTGP